MIRTLKELGRPEELARCLAVVREHFNDADAHSRSLVAQALFELGQVDTAKDLLGNLSADITPRSASDASAIEGMFRRGESEPALTLIRENRGSTDVWHTQARFAKAAAETQQYDTAFAVLDALEPNETFDDRAEGLTEIICAAVAHGNTGVVHKALEQLRTVERAARERSELKRAGVKIAKAYALAGDCEAAHNVATEVTDEPWKADRAIGVALSAAGRRREAASMLAKAWRG